MSQAESRPGIISRISTAVKAEFIGWSPEHLKEWEALGKESEQLWAQGINEGEKVKDVGKRMADLLVRVAERWGYLR